MRDCMSSILTKLATILVVNGDNSTITPYVRVWNNQLDLDEEGKMEVFPFPAMFLEIVTPEDYKSIGQGVHGSDITVRVRAIHEYYNAPDGTMAQDLVVFDLRDSVIANLNLWFPVGCGPLDFSAEHQDFKHKNLYHLVIDFKCHFIDYKGSRLDPNSPNGYTYSTPPTAVVITATKTVGGNPPVREFVIPQKR